MTKLILNTECKLYEQDGQAYCDSILMSQEFSRRHDHMLRMIDEITAPTSGVSKEFIDQNFRESKYKDASGKWNRKILMTRDGFIMVVTEIKTARARKVKETLILRFNQMEQFIVSLHSAKLEYPALTAAIMEAHEEPKHYHFSNEADMINRIVLGISAKQYRLENGIEKGASIRPHLSLAEIRAIETLQRVDVGLLVAIPEYEERKKILTQYHERMSLRRIA